MGTIYNVPVTWTKDTSLPNKEAYTGKLALSYPTGNVISGTWKEYGGIGITKTDTVTVYWNWLEVKSTITQGSEEKTFTYEVGGKYYPNGRSIHGKRI